MIKIRWRQIDPEHVRRYTFHERAVHLIVAVTSSIWS
jgi:cytochrome b subunit of formate dehydrogenase